MSMDNNVPTFKLVLVGDKNTGKTVFVKKHLTGNFEKSYVATVSAENHTLIFQTNRGPIKFDVWDTAGQPKIDAPRAEYYRHCQCAIIMFDLTSSVTLKNVTQWLKNLNQICNSIPVVLVGNKADHQNKQITTNRLKNHKIKGLSFYDISVKTEYNFEKTISLAIS